MVLLTMAPGDSQQELGTMFGLSGRWHKRQKDKLLAQWQVIPTKKFEKEALQGLPVDAAQEGIFSHLRMANLEFRPPSLLQLVEDQQFEPYPNLQQRTSKEDMQEKAHAGHTSEGAWTNTDSVGLGIASSMVHIVGVAVLFYGKAGCKYTARKNRKLKVRLDESPALGTPIEGAHTGA